MIFQNQLSILTSWEKLYKYVYTIFVHALSPLLFMHGDIWSIDMLTGIEARSIALSIFSRISSSSQRRAFYAYNLCMKFTANCRTYKAYRICLWKGLLVTWYTLLPVLGKLHMSPIIKSCDFFEVLKRGTPKLVLHCLGIIKNYIYPNYSITRHGARTDW